MRKSSGYGVFVKFRETRLTLRRGIQSEQEALAAARALRAARFHDGDSVFVMKEPEGILIPDPTLQRDASPAPPPAEAERPAEPAPPPHHSARVRDEAPASPRRAQGDLIRAAAQASLARLGKSIAGARVAADRVERALAAVDRLIARDGGKTPCEVLRLAQRTAEIHARARRATQDLERFVHRVSGADTRGDVVTAR